MKLLTYEQKLSKKKAADYRRRIKMALQAPKRPIAKASRHKKAKTAAHLKRDLDSVFSKYIRAKYHKYCYTCNKPSNALQCGHFVSRQYLATRWSEDNCRPQCWGCNGYGRGRLLDFEENLKEELGEAVVENLKLSRHTIIKLSVPWYLEQIESYEQKLAALS